MNSIIYIGPFKDHIQNYVKLKQAIGYNYEAEAGNLKRFDRFTSEKYPNDSTLTKEIVLDWCNKKSYEALGNQNARTSIIRQFAQYLDSIGIKAYIIPKGYYPKAKRYMPHIYTVEELTRFFAETNKCHYSSECPYRQLIMPVIFRMIYMCGLRASEARYLKVSDVDLNDGILTIRQSKKDNDRLVPMSDLLTKYCQDYSKKVHPYPVAEDYYFPGLNGKPITLVNLYHNFRRFLWHAGISHHGRGHGPRIHDFRHTYAVHCLKKWTEEEKDLSVYLPVLKTYMGHEFFEDTVYYLRLTVDVFPKITLKMETSYPELIPLLQGNTDETY